MPAFEGHWTEGHLWSSCCTSCWHLPPYPFILSCCQHCNYGEIKPCLPFLWWFLLYFFLLLTSAFFIPVVLSALKHQQCSIRLPLHWWIIVIPPGKHVNFKEKEWDKPLEIEEFMEHVLDEHKVSSKSWPPTDPVANHLIMSSPPHHLIVTQVTLNGSLLLAIALLTEEERKQLIIIVKPRQVHN